MKINLELIKEKRKRLGYNMNQMAEFLKLSNPSQYWKRENGTYNFKTNELPVISKKLNIPFNDLFLTTEYSKTEIDFENRVI